MVLLELMLNSRPACLGHNGDMVYPIYQVVLPQSPGALERAMAALDANASWPPLLAREVVDLALRCSDYEERRRPQFAEIARNLRQLCDTHCRGTRGARPHMAGLEPPTNPQLGWQAGGHGDPPTQPQMGLSPSAALQGAGRGDVPTCPQMGLGASPVTQPKMGNAGVGQVTQPRMCPAGNVPTCPKMGFGGVPGAGTAVPVGDVRTCPKMGVGGAPGGLPTRPQMHNFSGGIPEGSPGQSLATNPQCHAPPGTPSLGEVVLECTHSSGVDVANMSSKLKCLVLKAAEGPWTIGRMQQPEMFARLVPDETLRTVISRNHLLFTWVASTLQLKKLSPNVVLVNGAPAPPSEIAVTHGAKIEFLGRDNTTSFLTFTILLRDATEVSLSGPTPVPTRPDMPATAAAQQLQQQQQQRRRQSLDVPNNGQQPHSQQTLGAQQPPSWWFAGPPTPCSLVCVLAYGYDVTTKPLQMRTIGLPAESRTSVGRAHQHGFFEGILGVDAAQRYLCCVSRSHLEVAPAVGDALGGFEVTNFSSNPVTLAGQRRLGKGEVGMVRTGECIEFVGGNVAGATGSMVYLKLRLEQQRGSDIQVEPQPECSPVSKFLAPQTSSLSRFPPPSKESSTSGSAYPPATDRMASNWQHDKQPQAMLHEAVKQHKTRREVAPCFWLTLCGSAVKEGYPRDARRLEGGEDGLLVGRAHQKEIHSDAFDVELRQYLSRDHFRIDVGSDGSCKLVPISNNPMWRNRAGKRTEAIVGDPPLMLINGDAIQLFTGADDCTATGPGNLGSLLWIFKDAKSDGEPTEHEISILEGRSAGRVVPKAQLTSHARHVHDYDSDHRTQATSKNRDQSGQRAEARRSRYVSPFGEDDSAVVASHALAVPSPSSGREIAESRSSKGKSRTTHALQVPSAGSFESESRSSRSPARTSKSPSRTSRSPAPRNSTRVRGALRVPVDDASPPPLSQLPGALKAPVRDLSLDDDDDDDDGDDHHRGARELDLDFREVDDAFAASGFRF
eukprot:CAMPEP_0172681464 /NCGR_PEP_ID=MMETSP1074-20121228/17471_1 /TAXON_ID=2916 /ORGANISM="Ceratium fusus, Strain PA161109" /LENGTH=1008 /DNA_ID=CAMNT_0013499975 /DNA_START=87 /DNA_END=3113 /DNA_ORIENTATION=+